MFGDDRSITLVITLADIIKKLRDAREWSQTELGRQAGVSQSTIGNIEAGSRGNKRTIPASLPAIAAAFDLGTDDLLEMAGMLPAKARQRRAMQKAGTGGGAAEIKPMPLPKDEAALLAIYRDLGPEYKKLIRFDAKKYQAAQRQSSKPSPGALPPPESTASA